MAVQAMATAASQRASLRTSRTGESLGHAAVAAPAADPADQANEMRARFGFGSTSTVVACHTFKQMRLMEEAGESNGLDVLPGQPQPE